MSGNHHLGRWYGIPRDEIRWQPLVQSCLCDGCGLCVTSCPNKALYFDFSLNIPFVDPLLCLVGCSTCATLCPQEAILLPDKRDIQEIIELQQVDVVARKELRRRRKQYARVFPQAIYPDDVVENQN